MRFFLHLLTLLALLVAPLAAPAAAMPMTGTAAPRVTECTDIAMHMAGHEMPAGDHGQGKACCVAIPPAIDPPLTAFAAGDLLKELFRSFIFKPQNFCEEFAAKVSQNYIKSTSEVPQN